MLSVFALGQGRWSREQLSAGVLWEGGQQSPPCS